MATVVFVDVVDSTRVASEVGDARWRDLLGAFRSTVRRQLKKLDGHEVDTAGDGFFAWFDSPANAICAAVAICADVQESGLDVRCGLHTGELEQIDGRLGGIAAHIGARVMAAAGPAEILATSTVRDLVVGGAATFESTGDHELKGIPGNWSLHRVTSVDGRTVVAALDPADAAERRSGSPAVASARGRRAVWQAALAASLVVVGLVMVSAYGFFGFGRSVSATLSPTQLANASPSPTQTQPGDSSAATSTVGASTGTSQSPSTPLAMVQIDPYTNTVTAEVRDDQGVSGSSGLLAYAGNLFQSYDAANKLVQRDLSTGHFLRVTDLASDGCCGILQGFGSIWYAYRMPYVLIDRIDPTSGQVTKTLNPNIQTLGLAVGDRSVYVLDHEGQVHEIDPFSNQEVDSFPSQAATPPDALQYAGGKLYFFPDGLPGNSLTVVDATTHELLHTWTNLRQPAGLDASAVDSSTGTVGTVGTVWLANWLEKTVTALENDFGEPDTPTGLSTVPQSIAVGFGSIWVAAGQNVFRIGPADHMVQKTIVLPDGADATSIVMDDADGKIWVSNCHGPGC